MQESRRKSGLKKKAAFSSCRENAQARIRAAVYEDELIYAVLRTPFGSLSKGVWWMPRLKKAMKDAA